jgi:hypothetical protein
MTTLVTTSALISPPPTDVHPAAGPADGDGAEVDSRSTYLSFAFAYLIGHGSAALAKGSDPLIHLPAWLPIALLGTGLAVGTVFAMLAATRAQRGASDHDVRSGQLLGISWLSAFVALFLAITALSSVLDIPELSVMLWPAGSGLVVGLLYLGEGAARRNVLHYVLGTWLALTSTAALFFGTPGLFWVLALAGGGGFAVAAVLERRRLAARR